MANVLDYYDEETYLAHHGIKGQRWGVRRFQNSDGSLTQAGKLRYNTDSEYSTVSSLNNIEKQNAKLKSKRAIAQAKAERALLKGNNKKYQKKIEVAKEADAAIKSGDALAKKLISNAQKKGYTLKSIERSQYVNTGDMIIAGLLVGPVGPLTVATIDAYRANAYGNEAAGIVKTKRYSVG